MYNAENVINQIVMGGAAKVLEGGAKATVILTKNLVALLLALYQQRERTKGEISISNLEKRFPNINTLKLSEEQLIEFKQQAKRYNILYSVIRPSFIDSLSKEKDDYVDIVIAEKDAAKLERISEKLNWDSTVLDSLTTTKITKQKAKDSKDELMVEIESKNQQGQKLKMNVPLKNMFNPKTEAEAELFRSFLKNVDFVNPEGVVQNISDVNIEDELNKFLEKEKKLEAGSKEVLSEISQKPAVENKELQTLLPNDEVVEKKNKNEEFEIEETTATSEVTKDEPSGNKEFADQISLTEKLNEIKINNEQKKIGMEEKTSIIERERERT
ncbi:MAG: DUF3801 domain-containing protein [Saccharofermentanales bacterium]|jgi:hypothetical protein